VLHWPDAHVPHLKGLVVNRTNHLEARLLAQGLPRALLARNRLETTALFGYSKVAPFGLPCSGVLP
jgi:hypothetical protein